MSTMYLAAAVPLSLYVLASLLTIFSLRLPKKSRMLSLCPISLLSFLSLATSHKLLWPFGASSTFSSLVVFYFPYSVKLLAVDQHAIPLETYTHAGNFVYYYRIWNNPRNLKLVRTALLDDKSAPCYKSYERVIFACKQILRATGLALMDKLFIEILVARGLKHIEAADFAPEMELLTPSRVVNISSDQLCVRAVISIQWVWSAYFLLEFSHCLLGAIFVALGFDYPEEWLPLYGTLQNATSIRGFWGKFWHRITIPTYSYYSRLISRKVLKVQPNSWQDKTVVAMLVFFMSGLAHSAVAWSLGNAAASRDVLFFLLNFFAAAMETMVCKAKAFEVFREAFAGWPFLLRKVLGATWVLAFLFFVTPLWIYPKVHHALVTAVP